MRKDQAIPLSTLKALEDLPEAFVTSGWLRQKGIFTRVMRWIKSGKLAATPPESLQNGAGYRIFPRALRTFLIEHGAAWYQAQPDLLWLTDILVRQPADHAEGERGRPRQLREAE